MSENKIKWGSVLLVVVVLALGMWAIGTAVAGKYDLDNRNYHIAIGGDDYYCNAYAYDDEGNLALLDCSTAIMFGYNESNPVIRHPANVQIVEQK